MPETLIDQIRAIGNIPSYLDSDANKLMRKVFEEWTKRNNVVKDVMLNSASFQREYQRIFKVYEAKVNAPYAVPEGFLEQVEVKQLEECIGSSGLSESRIDNALNNPIGGGVSFGALGVAAGITLAKNYTPRNQKMDRRDFLTIIGRIGAPTLLVGAIGVVAGQGMTLHNELHLRSLEQNAIYLDNAHSRLYPK